MYRFAIPDVIYRIGILAGSRFIDGKTMGRRGGNWAFIFIGKANSISVFNIPTPFLGEATLTIIGGPIRVKTFRKFVCARALAWTFVNAVNSSS